MERQSMLGEADSLIGQVSGTRRVWMQSGEAKTRLTLLQHAPTWLAINPRNHPEFHPLFVSCSNETFLDRLLDLGITGIFLAPTGETAGIWGKQDIGEEADEVVHFSFSPASGTDSDYVRLQKACEKRSIQLGGFLPPAATGIGPDFMLQLRGQKGYEGLYAAIEVPKEFWSFLPDTESPWEGKILSPRGIEALISQGLLPEAMQKDMLPWAKESGWAASGIIMGVDGNARRFLYCFDKTPLRPVLSWQDPAGLAKRLYAAASIKHVGLEKHILAGLPLRPIMGLDPTQKNTSSSIPSRLEPGLTAMSELGQTIHRYGGASLFPDHVPIPVLKVLLTGTDFAAAPLSNALDSASMGKTEALRAILSSLLSESIPCERLANGLSDPSDNVYMRRSSANHSVTDETLLSFAIPIAMPGLLFLDERKLGLLSPPVSTDKDEKNRRNLKTLLLARQREGVALGSLLSIPRSPDGCVLVATKLPSNDIWLVACNFSSSEKHIPLPIHSLAGTMTDILDSSRSLMTNQRGTGILRLPPKTARHFIIRR